MKSGISFHGIGEKLVMEFTVDSLSMRDQFHLLAHLYRSTGVCGAMSPEGEEAFAKAFEFANKAIGYDKPTR